MRPQQMEQHRQHRDRVSHRRGPVHQRQRLGEHIPQAGGDRLHPVPWRAIAR
ncbi:hypothetical protein [Streptomyces sp. DSM 118878]